MCDFPYIESIKSEKPVSLSQIMKEELSMNKQVKPVVIGTIGAGYAAHLHGNGYEQVSGVPIRLKTVCDLNLDLANQVKERYGY